MEVDNSHGTYTATICDASWIFGRLESIHHYVEQKKNLVGCSGHCFICRNYMNWAHEETRILSELYGEYIKYSMEFGNGASLPIEFLMKSFYTHRMKDWWMAHGSNVRSDGTVMYKKHFDFYFWT